MSSNQPGKLLAAGVLLASTGLFNGAAPDLVRPTGAPPAAPLAAGMLADIYWLRAGWAWEQHDAGAVRMLTAICTALAPGEEYFRGNAARMRAFDFPAWQIARAPDAPAELRRRWRVAAADEALRFLLAQDPPSTAALLDAATIALYGAEDRLLAADYFRRAASRPGPHWHAGRICAELLHQAGRTREAADWLRSWLPQLPEQDPLAQRTRVEQRLAELERALAAPREAL